MFNKGMLSGIGAYLMWGFFPIYFKALQAVPALQIMFNRVIWSFIFLILLIFLRRESSPFKIQVAKPKVVLIYGLSAGLLAVNWLVYIYGVNSGQVLETSLGYFINPLLNVALGVIFFRERLRPFQWAPIGLAAIGVIYLTLHYGALPWIALALAFTFGMYGLIKKIAPLGALYGLTLETAILFLPAILYLSYTQVQGNGVLGHADLSVNILLLLSGVITTLPLLMFATAARAIPLYMLGLLQYIAPTCQFLLGVLVYHEPFTPEILVGFSMIWLALGLYWLEGFIMWRRSITSLVAS
jgi:chloramphenicol-sensitive protein RarD